MKSLTRFLLTLVVAVGAASSARAQFGNAPYAVFDSKGEKVAFQQVAANASQADVVFLGENHDDVIAHDLQAQIFKPLAAGSYGLRSVALSLEMFERDTQPVLDEYLSGLITERQFLDCSRPWTNYATDYRPLVEIAKEKKLPVIAANAPRRYANLARREGVEALNRLSSLAKTWIAPLPYPISSEAYTKKFYDLMTPEPGHADAGSLMEAQSLWDATMAYSIADYLTRTQNGFVVQVNGRFHSDSRLGTVERLLQYRPGTRVFTVSILSDDSFPRFNKALEGTADIIIITDPKKANIRPPLQ